jgi:uncharacterized membrane protein YccC
MCVHIPVPHAAISMSRLTWSEPKALAKIRSITEAGPPGQGSPVASSATFAARLTNASRAAGPPLLFGLRLWVSVCLALYIAFWLELDNAYWAGTTAALVCQPHLGASLRKG